MATYTELFVCETCGHNEYHNITAYGDYDGPDIPNALKDCSCCKGIKLANPDFFKRLEGLRKRQEYKIEQQKIRSKTEFNYGLTKACDVIYKLTKEKNIRLGEKLRTEIRKLRTNDLKEK
jgi:hypothetical protein